MISDGLQETFETVGNYYKLLIYMVSPAGFEPTAPGLGILCSILLSYGD